MVFKNKEGNDGDVAICKQNSFDFYQQERHYRLFN